MTPSDYQRKRVRAARLRRQRDELYDKLPQFSDEVLGELQRLSRYSTLPDGWGTGSHPDGGSRSTDETSTTERAALALVDGRPAYDVVQMSCYKIDEAFQQMWRAVRSAERAWAVIVNTRDAMKGRVSTLGFCFACLRDDVTNVGDDRIKAGYCPACHKAWTRTDTGSGRMDRLAFERSRRVHLVTESEDEGPGYAVSDLDALQASGTLPTPVPSPR